MSTLTSNFSGFSIERKFVIALMVCFGCVVFSDNAIAQTAFGTACTKVTGFFANFETILRVASVSIVTIAVVFAGYQIAFAHKRLSDVAPVLIGGLLIGGAAAISGWFVGDWTSTTHTLVTNQCPT